VVGLILEIDIGELLAVVVAHDEAGVLFDQTGQGGGKRRGGISTYGRK
jgi:hypothetical protein